MSLTKMVKFQLFGITLAFVIVALLPACPRVWADSPMTVSQNLAIQKIVHDYLMAHPDVVMQALQEAQKQVVAQQAATAKTALQQYSNEIYNDPESPILGNPKAHVTIVEYYDYQCPYCKETASAVDELVRQNPNVRVVMKEFPVLPPPSDYAARVALVAARYGKFSAFHDAIYAMNGRLDETQIMAAASQVGLNPAIVKQQVNDPTFTAEINQNLAEAQKLSIDGTPTFILNGAIVPGAITFKKLQLDLASANSQESK